MNKFRFACAGALLLLLAAAGPGLGQTVTDLGDVRFNYVPRVAVDFSTSGNAITLHADCVEEPPILTCPDTGPWVLSPGTPGGGFGFNIVHNSTGRSGVMGGPNVYRMHLDPVPGPSTWSSLGELELYLIVDDYETGERVGRATLVHTPGNPLRGAADGAHAEGCLDWRWTELEAVGGLEAAAPASAAFGPLCFEPSDVASTGEQSPNRYFAAAPGGPQGSVTLWGSNGDLENGWDGHSYGIDLRFNLACPADAPVVLPREDVGVRVVARLPDGSGLLPVSDFVAEYKDPAAGWTPLAVGAGGHYEWVAARGGPVSSVRVRIRVDGLTSAERGVSVRGLAYGELVVEEYQLVTLAVRLDSSAGVEFGTGDFESEIKVGAAYERLAVQGDAYRRLLPGPLNLRHRVYHNGRRLDRVALSAVNLPNNEAEVRFKTVNVVVRVLRPDGTEVPATEYAAQYKNTSNQWDTMDFSDADSCFMFKEELVEANTAFRVIHRGLTSSSRTAKLAEHGGDHRFEVDFGLVEAVVRLLDSAGSPVPASSFIAQHKEGSVWADTPARDAASFGVLLVPRSVAFRVVYKGSTKQLTAALHTHGGDFEHEVDFRLVRALLSLVRSDGTTAVPAGEYAVTRKDGSAWVDVPESGGAHETELLPVNVAVRVAYRGRVQQRTVGLAAHGGDWEVAYAFRLSRGLFSLLDHTGSAPLARASFGVQYRDGSDWVDLAPAASGDAYAVEMLPVSTAVRVVHRATWQQRTVKFHEHGGDFEFDYAFQTVLARVQVQTSDGSALVPASGFEAFLREAGPYVPIADEQAESYNVEVLPVGQTFRVIHDGRTQTKSMTMSPDDDRVREVRFTARA